VEGMHHEVVDGEKVLLPEDPATQQKRVINYDFESAESANTYMESLIDDTNEWMYTQDIRNITELQNYGKIIAGNGMPSSVYENYPDIQSATLFVEYASKIIIGEYSIDKFDEFVEKWNASGREAVTQNAREWYSSLGK